MKLKKFLPFIGIGTICLPMITSCSSSTLNSFINKLKKDEKSIVKAKKIKHSIKNNRYDSEYYNVYPFNNKVSEFITENRTTYNFEEINQLLDYYNNNLFQINLISNDDALYVGAATPSASGTNYESVWVRDSIWIYKLYKSFATIKPNYSNISKLLLIGIAKYFNTNKQIERMYNAMNNPASVLQDNMQGQMNAVHIRFSPYTLDDVYENGKAQEWTHKQNDALGLFLLELFDAIQNNFLSVNEINDMFKTIPGLIGYLNKLEYWSMEDSGSWEENTARRTSSIGLVTSAYEKFITLYESNNEFKSKYDATINAEQILKANANVDSIKDAITKSYVFIHDSLVNGGECVSYQSTDAKYRQADAALLDLIYPCELSQLKYEDYTNIYKIVVDNLSTDYGVKRYLDDSYQSANFWFNQNQTDIESQKTREKYYIKGSEASWFFNSWLAIADNVILNKFSSNMTQDDLLYFQDQIIVNMNKSLSQITSADYYEANGNKCDKEKLPESINVIVSDSGDWYYLPSPINPLNWSISSFGLAIQSLYEKIN